MQKRQGRTIKNHNLSLEIFLKKGKTYMAMKNLIFLNGFFIYFFFKFYCFGIVGIVDGNGWYTVEEVGGGWRCRF